MKEVTFKNERLLLLIPIHNYIEGVQNLLKFIKDNFKDLFDSYHISLIDNCSDQKTVSYLKSINDHNISFSQCNVNKSLKDTLSLGYLVGIKRSNPTIVSIWETDANPNVDVFKKMISVLINERKNKVASVTPMYKWNNNYCYPTHPHWFKDKTYKIDTENGEITNPHAVPFLFSVWDSSVFKDIKNESFRNFIGLDTDFGIYLTAKGYKHLRLKNHSIEHVGGGKKSW